MYIMDNILKAMSTYDSGDIEETILLLRKEQSQQEIFQQHLKDENHVEKSKEVTDFIERNEGQIHDQLSRLNDVLEKLKKTVSENQELEKNEDVYTEVITSDKSKSISNTLYEIKQLKKQALTFLESVNIPVQPK